MPFTARKADCRDCKQFKLIRGYGRCFKCFAVAFPDKRGGSVNGSRENQDSEEELERQIAELAGSMPAAAARQGDGVPAIETRERMRRERRARK